MLRTLFQIDHSGTHASAQVRASIIDELISSNVQVEQGLGAELLEAALSTRLHSPTDGGSFGSRPRDFGYNPSTNQEVIDWYRVFLAICLRTATLAEPIAGSTRRIFENSLRGLWWTGARLDPEFLEELKNSVIQIHAQGSWNAGWISVKEIIQSDGEDMPQDAKSKLEELSQMLRPATLIEQARTYALFNRHWSFDPEDDLESSNDISPRGRVHHKTRMIGAMVAQADDVFRELLPDILSNYSDWLRAFGEGLAEGSKDKRRTWQSLYKQLEKTPPERREIAVMLGFLSSCAVHDPDLRQSILDSLVNDRLLGRWFPLFQMTSVIDRRGVERLINALDEEEVDVYFYERLAIGRLHEAIDDDDLARLIQKLSKREGGIWSAISILNMRFYIEGEEPITYSQNLIDIARQVLLQYPYSNSRKSVRKTQHDYELARIASVSLAGQEGIESAAALCQKFAEGIQEYEIYSFDYPMLLAQLPLIQPIVFLETFVGIKDDFIFRVRGYDDLERLDNPVNQIPENILIGWCEQDPTTRYRLIVSVMQLYMKAKDSEELIWLPILSTIFDNAPNIQPILTTLESKIHPMSWSGSRADALAKRLSLFTKLFAHPNSEVRDWSTEQYQKLQFAIQKERERESRENQERFERFE